MYWIVRVPDTVQDPESLESHWVSCICPRQTSNMSALYQRRIPRMDRTVACEHTYAQLDMEQENDMLEIAVHGSYT